MPLPVSLLKDYNECLAQNKHCSTAAAAATKMQKCLVALL